MWSSWGIKSRLPYKIFSTLIHIIFVKRLIIRCLPSILLLMHMLLMQEHILKIDHVFLQALKGSKIQVETSYCSQDPRDRFNSSNYSYRTHHPTYRVMMSFLFYLCLFLYHILLSLPINLFFKTVLKTCPHLTFKATITVKSRVLTRLV